MLTETLDGANLGELPCFVLFLGIFHRFDAQHLLFVARKLRGPLSGKTERQDRRFSPSSEQLSTSSLPNVSRGRGPHFGAGD